MTVLVTGNAGFIGFHLTKRLLSEGIPVIGIDNINSYYDKSLKLARLKLLEEDRGFFVVFSSEKKCTLVECNLHL